MSTLEKVIAEVKTLAPEELQRVRALVDSLLSAPEGHGPPLTPESRIALARSIRGKYAHLPTGSEAFIALKREETKREDAKFRDRR